MSKPPSDWNASKGLAKMILRDRNQRRKIMFNLLLIALALMAGGLWVVDGWLGESPWRFLTWWGACAIVTLIVMLFALYDAFAVIREEREKEK
jgi:type VI protein secretion system component VasK